MYAKTSRRRFLRATGTAAGATMLGLSVSQFVSACRDADNERRTGRAFSVLSADEARQLEAIAACIVPTTDTPGAREAGSIYFIDRVLSTDRQDLLEPIRNGLEDLQRRARSNSAAETTFADLSEDAQISILTDIESSDFFYTVRLLTLAGLLGDPSYGGNRDRIGWDLIGFEGHFAHTAPYGYYDASYTDG